uniref:manganese catalase family protein n=1 Tax=Tetragenococcus halophilus TaxID=51669 RepID=UPI002E179A4B
MTKDKGIRDMLSYLMARETQHQLQFIQAQEELEENYGVVVPHGTKDLQHTEFSHTLMNFSEGEASREFLEGKTAKDGEKFKYEENPVAQGQEQETPPAPEALRNTQGDKEKTVEQGRKIIEQQQNMDK